MEFSWLGNFFIVIVMALVFAIGVFFMPGLPFFIQSASLVSSILNLQPEQPLFTPIPQKLSNPPSIIKGVYVTGYSAGSKSYNKYLSELFKKTDINAVIVDIKGSSGWVSYNSRAEEVKKYNLSYNAIKNIDSFVNFLHDNNIYAIGRIAVFEDPQYAKAKPGAAVYNKAKTTDIAKPVLWQDNNGLEWLDPSSKDAWDYNISLAKDAFLHGFDEINFDYVRFPTDGKLADAGFPVYDIKKTKSQAIKEFFEYLRSKLQGEKISVDLFGLVTVNTDDLGIGQKLEDALENFDYICPMVYPSHYAKGFIGFENPAEYPYQVIKYSLSNAILRQAIYSRTLLLEGASKTNPAQLIDLSRYTRSLAKIRPWIQDFDMGADYTASMVKQEIRATEESLNDDYSGFMLWNPWNIYTQDAILKPQPDQKTY